MKEYYTMFKAAQDRYEWLISHGFMAAYFKEGNGWVVRYKP